MIPKAITCQWRGETKSVPLTDGHCIAIPLDHTSSQPNAFFAPLYEASPHRAGDWTGDTREGAPVNFYDVRLNPHGNGTHTECLGHITKERYHIHDSLDPGFWIAQLISVYPTLHDNGDRIIDQLEWEEGIEALILRTMPNHPDKKSRHYGGTNPPYLDVMVTERIVQSGIQHVLLDLPSVDREEDAGALASHHMFWQTGSSPRRQATITEMVYVDNVIPDGLYLLEIQIPAMRLDAAPSRPVIYPMK